MFLYISVIEFYFHSGAKKKEKKKKWWWRSFHRRPRLTTVNIREGSEWAKVLYLDTSPLKVSIRIQHRNHGYRCWILYKHLQNLQFGLLLSKILIIERLKKSRMNLFLAITSLLLSQHQKVCRYWGNMMPTRQKLGCRGCQEGYVVRMMGLR